MNASLPCLLVLLSAAATSAMGADLRHGNGDDQATFRQIDTSNHGYITRDEWQAAGHKPRAFDALSGNGSDKVTEQQFHEAMERMRQRNAQVSQH